MTHRSDPPVVFEPILVLWDVDHTLMSAGGLSRRMYEAAFLKAGGVTLRELADLAGRTERAILSDTLALHDIPISVETLDAYYAALSAVAHELRDAFATEGRALAGSAEATAMLAGEGVTQTLVTGNLRPIAAIKLEAFDLATHIDFEIGGYGSDGSERVSLIQLARERAAKLLGHRFAADRIIVIGDTPHDINAAKQAGVRSIGVATGRSSGSVLADVGADVVLPDLRDTQALREIVLGGRFRGATPGPAYRDTRSELRD